MRGWVGGWVDGWVGGWVEKEEEEKKVWVGGWDVLNFSQRGL